MKGETALGIIAVLAFIFILVFLLATSGAGGEAAVSMTDIGTAAGTSTPSAVPTTPIASETPKTPLPAQTPTEGPTDPVVGRWIADTLSNEELVLNSNGTGTLIEGNITHAATWKEDRETGVAGMRAYRLTVLGHTESILYLRNMTGTLSRNGPGIALTYTRSP